MTKFDNCLFKPPAGSFVLILVLFVLMYGFNISNYFFTLPSPSDPLQYLGPSVWKSTYGYFGYFGYLDRINLVSGLRVFSMFISPIYLAGPCYIIFVELLTLIIGLSWCYKVAGKWAMLIFAIIINSSYMTLSIATYIYPVQTAALYSLLAVMCFYYRNTKIKYFNLLIFSGIFSGLACFSKVSEVGGLIFLFSYLLFIEKSLVRCLKYCVGVMVGVIVSLGVFVILFNYQSLFNLFDVFFRTFRGMCVPDSYKSNVVQYLYTLLDFRYFPVFISLFIAVDVYKKASSRLIVFYSWSFIVTIFAIYAFISGRGGYTIPYYIYTPYIVASLGLSIYFANIVNDQKNKDVKFPLFVILLFVCCGIGMLIGFNNPVIEAFNTGYNYYQTLDMYTVDTKIFYNYFTKVFYILGPIAIIVLLTFVEGSKSKKAVLFLLVVVSLFSSAYNGGIARKKAKADSGEANFFYDIAPVFNQVDDTKFAVYIKNNTHVDRLLWVYGLFFDKKYRRGISYDSAVANEKDIQSNIKIITEPSQFIATDFGNTILTDDQVIVMSLFKASNIIKTIQWKDKSLYIIRVTQ